MTQIRYLRPTSVRCHRTNLDEEATRRPGLVHFCIEVYAVNVNCKHVKSEKQKRNVFNFQYLVTRLHFS